MFDHIGFAVRDMTATRTFYAAALAPLGLVLVREREGAIAFGRPGRPQLWFYSREGAQTGLHICLRATTRAQVDAFHAAALAAGAVDNGAPGPRPQYTPTYYGGFVLDPDGHNLEAVCHATEA